MMHLPNYKDGSTINLMSSISKSFGDRPKYKPLKLLKPSELSGSKNVVLLAIDGFGYEFLMKHGKGSTFSKYLRGKITTTFPSTTAVCVTAFHLGVPAQQHAFTGWFMLMKELGIVATTLRFNPRLGGPNFTHMGVDPRDIYDIEPIFNRIRVKSHEITHEHLIESHSAKIMAGKAKRLHHGSMPDLFKKIRKVISSSKKRKYIFAYWDEFDHHCHEYGTKHKKTLSHFKKLDKNLSAFIKSIEGTDTTVIITADHGLIDAKKSEFIYLNNHPKLVECLTLPACGEGRTAYLYVHPSKAKQFESYVKKKLGKYCWLFKSEDLVKKNFFGLFEPNKKLFDRIGDYVLIMKGNYVLRDPMLGRKDTYSPGHHGGVSSAEMFVPLIVIKK